MPSCELLRCRSRRIARAAVEMLVRSTYIRNDMMHRTISTPVVAEKRLRRRIDSIVSPPCDTQAGTLPLRLRVAAPREFAPHVAVRRTVSGV